MLLCALQARAGLMEEIADGVVVAQSRHDDGRGRVGNLPASIGKGNHPARATCWMGTMPAERRQLERAPAGQEACHEQKMMHMGEDISFEVIINPIDHNRKAGLLQFQQALDRLKRRLLRTELHLIDTDHIGRRRSDALALKLSFDSAQAIREQNQGGRLPCGERPADNKASLGSCPALALIANPILGKDKKRSTALTLKMPGEELHILRLLRLHAFRMNQKKRRQTLSFHRMVSPAQAALQFRHRGPYQLIQRIGLLMPKVQRMGRQIQTVRIMLLPGLLKR